MSEADDAQNRHDLPTAIRARLDAVSAEGATAQAHHQLGVLLSELAESARRIGGPGWDQQARLLLSHAQRHLRIANDMLEVCRENLVLHAGIHCDAAIALARESWLATQRFEGAMKVVAAGEAVNMAIELLERWLRGPETPRTPALVHQLAIAFSFAARLKWGQALGFAASEESTAAMGYGDLAATYFEREGLGPDDGRAFRSHLLTMALAYDESGRASMRRYHARLARILAKSAGDVSHARRARVIWWFGNRGERWLRRRRDGKVIAEVCAELAAQ